VAAFASERSPGGGHAHREWLTLAFGVAGPPLWSNVVSCGFGGVRSSGSGWVLTSQVVTMAVFIGGGSLLVVT